MGGNRHVESEAAGDLHDIDGVRDPEDPGVDSCSLELASPHVEATQVTLEMFGSPAHAPVLTAI
ncbi:MAG: hypothetical protein ACRD0Z_10100 [Acidimicrobiales bacterium]